jgi:hypothetical protein
MNIIRNFVASLMLFVLMISSVSGLVFVNAQNNSLDPCAVTTGTKPAGCGSSFFTNLGINTSSLSGSNGIRSLIASLANLLILILASASVLYLIFGAYKMISDDGSGKGFQSGLASVKYALLGLVVAILSFAIVQLVVRFVGGA